jgi:3-dehydroquinate synthase
MPGSGKTALGKYAAEKLQVPFIDSDEVIKETTGKSISDFFMKEGEERFRSIERDIIYKASLIRNVVISTGGGAWHFKENQKNLKKDSIIIYLYCDLEEIWNRLQKDEEERPLLKNNYNNLKDLFTKRHEVYKEADYVLNTTKKSFEELWAELSSTIKLDLEKESFELSKKYITVKTSQNKYQVIIGDKLISSIGNILNNKYKNTKPRILIVTNPYIKALFGSCLINSLNENDFETCLYLLPEGEQNKSLYQAEKAYSFLVKNGFDRGDLIVGLGGGVIGDFAGFIAATYMRGLAVVQIPTTLLAQVDASIGGKTAVNLTEGKNLVGVFHQPEEVLIDINAIRHLSDYHYRQGIAECIKYGVLGDKNLFIYFEENAGSILNRDMRKLQDIAAWCCKIKADIVAKDEKEKGLRAVLNLGHTIGHALEASAGYGNLGHGDAVALGMRAEAYMGTHLDITDKYFLQRLNKLLDYFSFPSYVDFSLKKAVKFIKNDKKRIRGKARFVIPTCLGDVKIIDNIKEDLIVKVFKYIGDR